MMMVAKTDQVWKELYELLERFIRSRVRDGNLVDDLVQESFLRIHKGLHTLKNPERLSSWALTIARRSIADHFRGRRLLSLDVDPVAPDFEAPIEAELIDCATAALLGVLPEKYRHAVQRCDIEGVSQKQLAEELGLSVSAAKSRVQRGRALMKKKLLECCELEFDRRGRIIDYDCHDPDSCMMKEYQARRLGEGGD